MIDEKYYTFLIDTRVPEAIAQELEEKLRKYCSVPPVEYWLNYCRHVRLYLRGDVEGSILFVYGGECLRTWIELKKSRKLVDELGNPLPDSVVKNILQDINEKLNRDRKNASNHLREFLGQEFDRLVKYAHGEGRDIEISYMVKMLLEGKHKEAYIGVEKKRNGRRVISLMISVPTAKVHGYVRIRMDKIGELDQELVRLLTLLADKTSEEQVTEPEVEVEEVTQEVENR